MTDQAKAPETKTTGTVGGANPESGSGDAARGLGGHSKDASHGEGAPAQYTEKGEAKKPG